MRCPSCGAIAQHSGECSECGAIQDQSLEVTGQVQLSQIEIVEEPAPINTKPKTQPASSLIEFPGVIKTSIPLWRKELGERVREVQERRAREAMLEAGLATAEVGEDEARTSLLELLPPADTAPVNPLVAAALQRIERANTHSGFSGNAAVAMLAYDEQSEFGSEPSAAGDSVSLRKDSHNTSARSEKVHNLAVVPPQQITPAATPSPIDTPAVDKIEGAVRARKPKRLIGDLNDPALNYLDSIPVAVCVDIAERRSAPVFFRFLSAILDIVVVCLLSSPVVALVKLTDLQWQDSRTLAFAFGTLIVMGFLYFTITTAFTGRTLGMRPFSLRVVDARTDLIPTGGQSAARALIYMLSLASAGIALFYTLVDSERRAAHDRITRTAVVRV